MKKKEQHKNSYSWATSRGNRASIAGPATITEFYRVLPSFPELEQLSPSFTQFYPVLTSFTGFYWVLPSFT